MLLASALNVAAVIGLAYIAGFHAVYVSLTRIVWPWLLVVPDALAISAAEYYLAYRGIYAAEGGYQLNRRQLTAVVAAGFDGLFDTGGIRPDGLVLQASGASRHEAMVRVTTLGGMEQAILALYGCAASIAWLCRGRPGVPVGVTLPWAVIPGPGVRGGVLAGVPVPDPAAGASRLAGQAESAAPCFCSNQGGVLLCSCQDCQSLGAAERTDEQSKE